jgi:hypothetical protein
MCQAKDVPGKGKGLIANENIPKGTRILLEEPVIKILERQQDDCELTSWPGSVLSVLIMQEMY